MATAVQLSQGNEFARSAENGQTADSATRIFRVILNSPGESWDIPATVGVNIGDPYSEGNPLPCVSFEARADGESRLVRIVTVRYKSTPGFASDGVSDPKTEQPTARPALYSMSTALQEITAWGGRKVEGGGSMAWKGAYNPVGDMVDGITKLEPIITINIDQYSYTDQSAMLEYAGHVNSDEFTFSGLSVGLHQCMLQSVNSRAVVEQFGASLFRGFIVSFVFAIRRHYTFTRNGVEAVGWDMAIPQTGFNIINSRFGDSAVDQQALVCEHEDGKVKRNFVTGSTTTPAEGTDGKKVRGMVSIPAGGGGFTQLPCSQPIALNDDGTPRNTVTQTPKVLINRLCLQPEATFGNNFSSFGIRWVS